MIVYMYVETDKLAFKSFGIPEGGDTVRYTCRCVVMHT